MTVNSENTNKLGFSDILKQGSTLVAGQIREDRQDLARFINETKKEQEQILKLKEVDTQQLKIVIKL